MTARPVRAAASLVVLLVSASACSSLGGAWKHQPRDYEKKLSWSARAAVAHAWSGLRADRLLDHHTHMTGLGAGNTGCWVNPIMRSVLHPVRYAEFHVLMSASAITDVERADEQYVERIVELVRATPNHGRHALLAFDAFHGEDGARDEERSTFFVPNEFVIETARKYPDVFVPVASIHPYRKDAVAALESAADAGVRLVKWLPNGMGIDPLNPLCTPFYDALERRGVALLSHAGDENAVVADCQSFGNPLRLRAALDRGVRVIVAHCAGLGEDEDLDRPEKPMVPSFDLFMRLMRDPKYDGLLFGEISATILRNRIGTGVLETLLDHKELHERLVNGSDYPLPAAKILIKLDRVVATGMITNKDRAILEELYDVNPLLYDFMIKRMLRKDGVGFPASVFEDRLGLLAR